jgi:hypothetical protein
MPPTASMVVGSLEDLVLMEDDIEEKFYEYSDNPSLLQAQQSFLNILSNSNDAATSNSNDGGGGKAVCSDGGRHAVAAGAKCISVKGNPNCTHSPPILFAWCICISSWIWMDCATVLEGHAKSICMSFCISRWAQPNTRPNGQD